MVIRFLIFKIILYAFLATAGYAQQSAQAVIQVSVTVVKSSQMQVPPAVKFNLTNYIKSDESNKLGTYLIKGLNEFDSYVKFPESVLLKNKEEESIQIPLKIARNSSNGVFSYSVTTTSVAANNYSAKSKYKGNYIVSLIHL